MAVALVGALPVATAREWRLLHLDYPTPRGEGLVLSQDPYVVPRIVLSSANLYQEKTG